MEEHHHKPPGFALWLLRAIIRPRYLHEIEGDMEEVFREDLEQHSSRKAKWLYLWNVLLLLRISLIKTPHLFPSFNHNLMIRNYLKSGWRNFLKYRRYSLINVLGLSIGFGTAILLFMIVSYENSFDTFHQNHQDLYRVANRHADGEVSDLIVTPQLPLMKREMPEVLRASRFYDGWDMLEQGDQYIATSYHIVDPDFAQMFDFEVLKGDVARALSTPGQAVITKSLAAKLFGQEDPLGKTLRIVSEDIELTVSALIRDVPQQSSMQFELLIPWDNAPEWLGPDQAGNWYNTFMTGYVQLHPQTDIQQLEEKSALFVADHFLEGRRSDRIAFLPLLDEHFRATNNKKIIYILGIIAGAILLISCFNFMNLAISQFLGRTREIGVRKVMGSQRAQLVFQFMVEGFIVCTVAIVLGLLITFLAIPYANEYLDLSISRNIFRELNLLGILAALIAITVMLCTLWPSFTLSGFPAVRLMRDFTSGRSSGGLFRKGLIVLQFTASVILIIGTIVVLQQTRYMKQQDLKFDGNNVVLMEVWPELFFSDPEAATQKLLTMRNELDNQSLFQSATLSQSVPGNYNEDYNGFTSADSTATTVSMRQTSIDHRYLETFGIKLVRGRNFSPDIESDKEAKIINETAFKSLGWTDLKDRRLKIGGGGKEVQVIGVVEDYHYQSLKRAVQPVILHYNPDYPTRLAVRLDPNRISEALALLEQKWDELGPYKAFDYSFVDEEFDLLYKEQERLSLIATLFAFIGMAIACLGLFSISSYTIRLRKKEIGIRKVLGATISNIVLSLSRNFGLLVLGSFLIAVPVIYFLSLQFLKDYSYRIDLSPWIFILGIGVVFVVAMVIVGTQSRLAAMENPVDALVDE